MDELGRAFDPKDIETTIRTLTGLTARDRRS